MEKDLYIAIGNQQKFNNKSYYTIKSLKTAKYLFLNNDVGIQRNGIYVEDLKALLQNPVCDMDVINLGINSNGNFYERNMANTEYGESARKDVGGICYRVGSIFMKRYPQLKCKYEERPLTKKKDYGFLAEGHLEIIGRYRLILKKDYLGYYYLYDDKFLCVEAIKTKKEIINCMFSAIQESLE